MSVNEFMRWEKLTLFFYYVLPYSVAVKLFQINNTLSGVPLKRKVSFCPLLNV